MTTNNICMYFKIDPASLSNPETLNTIMQLGTIVLGRTVGDVIQVPMGGQYGKLIIIKGENDNHLSLRIYDHGLVTFDAQFLMDGSGAQVLNMEYIRALEMKIKKCLANICKEINCIYCPLRRGQPVWPYAVTADDRILEHDYDKLLVDVQSPWQQVRIFHSRQFDNVLLLDGDNMLGESDLIYTQTVCGIGQEDYKDKDVLILGGGDGGILHELLKEKPNFVTMVEIDEEVIKACRTHMRKACGDALDKYEGPNYKVIIGDCVKFLHECIQAGKQFDYVINDLTEFPVDKAVKGFGYDFGTTSLITEMSMQTVKKGGKQMSRGNCVVAYEYRAKLEADIIQMGCEFLRKELFVPSFEENYCFYQIWRKGEISTVATQNGCCHSATSS